MKRLQHRTLQGGNSGPNRTNSNDGPVDETTVKRMFRETSNRPVEPLQVASSEPAKRQPAKQSLVKNAKGSHLEKVAKLKTFKKKEKRRVRKLNRGPIDG